MGFVRDLQTLEDPVVGVRVNFQRVEADGRGGKCDATSWF